MTWAKGESGNMNGRPKKGNSWAEKYEDLFGDEIDQRVANTFLQILLSEDEGIQLKAITEFWNRKYGKAKETMDANIKGEFNLIEWLKNGERGKSDV